MKLALVLLFAVLALGQETLVPDFLPYGDAKCVGSDWTKVDRTADYAAATTVPTKICVKTSGMEVCSTPSGVAACNTYHSKCQKVSWTWSDKDLYPSDIIVQPSVCSSQGFVMPADATVLIIAQIIFSFLLLIAAFVLTLVAVAGSLKTKLPLIVSPFLLLMGLVLTFSYFYLNGLVLVGATIAALSLFRPNKAHLTAVGIIILTLAFYWTTFQYGLGNIQHHSRLVNDNFGSKPTYEDICLNYYRYYFYYPEELHDESDSLQLTSWGFCARGWLAAELYFMILGQLLLVLLAAAGAADLLSEGNKQVSTTEPIHGEGAAPQQTPQ